MIRKYINTQHPLESIDFSLSHGSFLIEASAGTGKTWTIERLFIKALLTANTEISKILLVTFTTHATAELRIRIATTLHMTILQLDQPAQTYPQDIFSGYLSNRQNIAADRKKLLLAQLDINNMAIMSIDAFCQHILRCCDYHAHINIVSNKKSLVKQLIADFYRHYIIQNTAFTTCHAIVQHNLQILFTLHTQNGYIDIIEAFYLAIPADFFLLQAGKLIVRYTLDTSLNLNSSEYLKIDLALTSIQQRITAKAILLHHLICYLVNNYPDLHTELTLTHYEVLQLASDLIIHNIAAADMLYKQFPVAFIDEFHDTSNHQWQIFQHIYRAGSRGFLIAVGDPKQAIYNFRGADVGTYIQASKSFEYKFSLNTNFRSHSTIIEFINLLFANQPEIFGKNIIYTDMIASSSKNELCTAELLTQTNKNHRFYDNAVHIIPLLQSELSYHQQIYNHLVYEILQLLSIKPQLNIAVLVVSNAQAEALLNQFNIYNIQAAVAKNCNVFATETARAFYLLLTAIYEPDNQQAIAAVLKTQLINLPLQGCNDHDSAIYQFKQQLYKYHQLLENIGIFAVLYMFIADLLEINPQDIVFFNQEMIILWQLAELLEDTRKYRNYSTYEILQHFALKLHSDSLTLDIAAELLIQNNSGVQIMTQHAAKGLEYEVVFCPYFRATNTDIMQQLPQFAHYHNHHCSQTTLVTTTDIASILIEQAIAETQRLNYVALTRAKQRLYIYLQEPKQTAKKMYTQRKGQETADLACLFGFNKDNPSDDKHINFNYHVLFSASPHSGLKQSIDVAIYRYIDLNHEYLLTVANIPSKSNAQECIIPHCNLVKSYTRQSYSSLIRYNSQQSITTTNTIQATDESDKYSQLCFYLGITELLFANLLHELCALYNPSLPQLCMHVWNKYQINDEQQKIILQYLVLIWHYPIVAQHTLSTLTITGCKEFAFNLCIADDINMQKLQHFITQYFGRNHPFSLSVFTLTSIKAGFLVGAIDLVCEINQRYWVIDYKTNKLSQYTKISLSDTTDELSYSMSEHYYYLQYLIYLVAVKRYLECRLSILDASSLIGGAIYFYIRGMFEPNLSAGIFCDNNCNQLVAQIDELFKASVDKQSH